MNKMNKVSTQLGQSKFGLAGANLHGFFLALAGLPFFRSRPLSKPSEKINTYFVNLNLIEWNQIEWMQIWGQEQNKGYFM